MRVSTGFLDSLYSEGADGLEGFLVEVLDQLMAADVVHVDETSDKMRTETIWFHVACTELLTLLHADETRGPAGIERLDRSNEVGTVCHREANMIETGAVFVEAVAGWSRWAQAEEPSRKRIDHAPEEKSKLFARGVVSVRGHLERHRPPEHVLIEGTRAFNVADRQTDVGVVGHG